MSEARRKELADIALSHATEAQWRALDELIKLERADALKHLTGGPGLQLRCAFCGERYPEGTPDHKHAGLEAHIRVCALHPIGIENQKLRRLVSDMLPHINHTFERGEFRRRLFAASPPPSV